MIKTLLAGTALVGAALAAGPAWAGDAIKLDTGGFFNETYMAVDGGGARFGNDEASTSTCLIAGICADIDDVGDAQRFIYSTPTFGDFQLSVSYAPDTGAPTRLDGAGPQIGMGPDTGGESAGIATAYGAYSYEGEGWGLTAGVGGSWEDVPEQTVAPDTKGEKGYQLGVNLSLGNLGIGGLVAYYQDPVDQGSSDVQSWVAGIGAGYTMDDWSLGLQYLRLDQSGQNAATDDGFQQDRLMLTGNYALGPGISLDGALGYSWIDGDSESSTVGGTKVDDHNAFEIGIGTNFTF